MSIASPLKSIQESDVAQPTATKLKPRKRSLLKQTTQLIRRSHLYLGLFLLPWAIMYGFTGFLFNHPYAFRDTPNKTFGAAALVGTPLENRPSPTDQAQLVITQLNQQQTPETAYQLVGEADYAARQSAFVTVKYHHLKDKVLSVAFNLTHSAGGVHYEGNRERKPLPKAPFTAGPPVATRSFGGGGNDSATAPDERRGRKAPAKDGPQAAIQLEDRLEDRVLATVPMILERTGFPPADEIIVTTIPTISFTVDCGGEKWNALYDPRSGGISGTPVGSEPKTELGWRRFLTQLHVAHVYPYEKSPKWYWAILVDAMAFIMVFWGISGLIMWWQLKSTRKWGLITLAVSAIVTVVLGYAMHGALTS